MIDLLSDRADGKDSFTGYGGIVKTNQEIIIRQCAVFPDEQIQHHIGKRVAGDENSLLLSQIKTFQSIKDCLDLRQCTFVVMSKFFLDDLVIQAVFTAEIGKAPEASISRNIF